jgi:CubicO group peptidase (beta-lactamase class C family)
MISSPSSASCRCSINRVTLPNNQAATRQKGFGLGVEVTTDLGQLSIPSSIGQFGWYGAASTYCQMDPKERIVAVALLQHFPFNEHNFFATSRPATIRR